MMSRATIFWLIALAGMVVMTVTVSLKVNRVNAQTARRPCRTGSTFSMPATRC